MAQHTFFTESLDTPTGPMQVVTDADGALRVADWDSHAERLHTLLRRHYGPDAVTLRDAPRPTAAAQALAAYFAGDYAAIDALPTATGGTAFQREVWAGLRLIPRGETWSYGRLAAHLGRPKAVRAVGLANGQNPIAIVVPCHRVIGSNNTLTGYGGGLDRKRWLLAHEGVLLH